MHDQQSPFRPESIYDALEAIVAALGGPKAVGMRLYPTRTMEASRKLILHRLDPGRPEKFDPGEVVVLFRWAAEAGYHDAMAWLVRTLGYAPTSPLEPEQRREDLQREFIAALKRAEALEERLRGIPPSKPRAVA
jgi:hypothetical protein